MKAIVNPNSMTIPVPRGELRPLHGPRFDGDWFPQGQYDFDSYCLHTRRGHLKVETQFSRVVSRLDEVGAAESGEKVKERRLVCQVDGGKP